MSAGRQLCLKWNDFQTNVSKSFSVLRNCSDFQDVTLVSDDHQKLSAHRIILSTCSEYFREVLRGNEEQKPILCLENVSFKDLESILDYIYHGETQVEQKYVQRFLKLAQRFKLEGLQETTVDDDSIDSRKCQELQSMDKNSDNGSYKSPKKTLKTRKMLMEMLNEYTKPSSVHSDVHGELFPPLGSRGPKASKAWNYGGLKKDLDGNLIKDKMYCALCPKTFRYTNSPSALQDHLNHIHIMEMTRKMIFKLTETSPVQSKFHGDLFPPSGSKGPRASMSWTFGGLKKDSDGNLMKDKMYCALCPQTFKYVSSPSTMLYHLRSNHREEIHKEQNAYDLMLMEENEEPSDFNTSETRFSQKEVAHESHQAPTNYSEMTDFDLELSVEKEESSDFEVTVESIQLPAVQSEFHGDLFPPQGSKGRKASMAWKYGGFKNDSDGNILKENMYCALCPKVFDYRGSPSPLRDHVMNNHIKEYYKEQTGDIIYDTFGTQWSQKDD